MANQKGSKKIGRFKRTPSNAAYATQDRRRKNKLRNMRKYCKNNPNCTQSAANLRKMESFEPANVAKPRRKLHTIPLPSNKDKRRNILTNNRTVMVGGQIHMVYRGARR